MSSTASVFVDGVTVGSIEFGSSEEVSATGRATSDSLANPVGHSLGSLGPVGHHIGSGAHGTERGTGADQPAYHHAPGNWWTPQRQRHAIDYLKKNAELPDVSARAMVARWAGVEAAGGPSEVNSIGAAGIAQWLGARRNGVKLGDFEGQLGHVVHELKGTAANRDPGAERAYQMLKDAKTEREAATGASQYERAEGYNQRTGADYYVGKTIGTMHSLNPAPEPTASE